MQLDKVYTFNKGSEEYDIIKYGMSRKARKKLGIKFPFFGEYRNKVVVPESVYQLVIGFLFAVRGTPTLYMVDVIVTEQDG